MPATSSSKKAATLFPFSVLSFGPCVCPFAIEGVLVSLLLPVLGWGTASGTASRTCSTGLVSARICVHLHPKTPINTVFIADLGDLRTGFIPARAGWPTMVWCSSRPSSVHPPRARGGRVGGPAIFLQVRVHPRVCGEARINAPETYR